MSTANETGFGELSGVEQTTVHGLPAVRVATDAASGLVFLQGAHVAAWQPALHGAVIWMSEKAIYAKGKPLRGGVPICFPWFGPHPEHKEYPQHGFARTTAFTYHGARRAALGGAELEFALVNDSQTEAFFPHAFEAKLRVTFGHALRLELEVSNRDAQPFEFEEALHSYFAVADVRQASVLGLQGSSYLDKVQGMAKFTEGAAELYLSGETDRVYESNAACTIRDPGERRSILIEKAHSQATVVWNPWSAKAAQMADFEAEAWPHMLCVESANVGKARVVLAPGASHILRVDVSLSAPVP
jgi:glucose-6-phosphate 1-epimerase